MPMRTEQDFGFFEKLGHDGHSRYLCKYTPYEELLHPWPLRASQRISAYTSKFETVSALSWMNSRRGSTTSPISFEKISSTSVTSPILT